MATSIITKIHKKEIQNIRKRKIFCYEIQLVNGYHGVLILKKDKEIFEGQEIRYKVNEFESRIIELINGKSEEHIIHLIIGENKTLSKSQERLKEQLPNRTIKNIGILFSLIIRFIAFIHLLFLFVMNEFVLGIIPQEYIIEGKIINIILLIGIAISIYRRFVSTESIIELKDLYDDHYEDKFLKEFYQ